MGLATCFYHCLTFMTSNINHTHVLMSASVAIEQGTKLVLDKVTANNASITTSSWVRYLQTLRSSLR